MHGRACGKYLPVWLSIAAGYDDLGQNGGLIGPRLRGTIAVEMHQIRYFLAVCETLNFTRAAEVLQRLAAVADPRHQGAGGRAGRAVVPPRAQQHPSDRAGRDDAPASHAGADRDRRRQGARQELRQARRCRAEARHDVHHRPAPLRAVPAGLPRAPSQGAADRAGRLEQRAPGAAGAGRARCRGLRPARGDRRALPCPPSLRRALRDRRRAGPSLRQAERRARAATCTTRPTATACNASTSAMPAASSASTAASRASSSAATATTGCRAWRWREWASPSSPNSP